MEKLEEHGRRRAQRRDFQRAILATVSAIGLLAFVAVPTNLPMALAKLGMLPLGPRDGGTVNRARNRLLKKKLLVRTAQGFLTLTPEGERHLRRIEIHGRLVSKKRRWDGRWRVLIFDVPEYRRGVREQIRRTLREVGFVRLQDSVWIYPYDCEDYVALLKADFKIGKDVLYRRRQTFKATDNISVCNTHTKDSRIVSVRTLAEV